MQLPLVSWVSCNKTTKTHSTMYMTTIETRMNVWVELHQKSQIKNNCNGWHPPVAGREAASYRSMHTWEKIEHTSHDVEQLTTVTSYVSRLQCRLATEMEGNCQRVRSDAQPTPFSVSAPQRTTLEQVVGVVGMIARWLLTLPHGCRWWCVSAWWQRAP